MQLSPVVDVARTAQARLPRGELSYTLRTLDEAKRLYEVARAGARIAIIGGLGKGKLNDPGIQGLDGRIQT